MIPIKVENFDDNINIIIMPSSTFKINFEKNRLVGNIDNANSLAQSIYKILMTKRYKYAIYNWDYGLELDDLFGMPMGYVKAELERRITDAISIDDRVEDVYNFQITNLEKKGCLYVKFTVKSSFGEVDLDWEVEI